MKIVRATVKERKIGENKWVYASAKFSVADMGMKAGDELELIVMTREEWERRQAEITMLYEKIKQCQQLIISQLEMCRQTVQLTSLQLQEPQPIQQRRPRRGRRPRQRPQQRPPQPQQPPRPQPPSAEPPIEQPTVPAELTEKLLKNEWVKILRTRH